MARWRVVVILDPPVTSKRSFIRKTERHVREQRIVHKEPKSASIVLVVVFEGRAHVHYRSSLVLFLGGSTI